MEVLVFAQRKVGESFEPGGSENNEKHSGRTVLETNAITLFPANVLKDVQETLQSLIDNPM